MWRCLCVFFFELTFQAVTSVCCLCVLKIHLSRRVTTQNLITPHKKTIYTMDREGQGCTSRSQSTDPSKTSAEAEHQRFTIKLICKWCARQKQPKGRGPFQLSKLVQGWLILQKCVQQFFFPLSSTTARSVTTHNPIHAEWELIKPSPRSHSPSCDRVKWHKKAK